jgi:hypothetical protein
MISEEHTASCVGVELYLEVLYSSKMLVTFYKSTQCQNTKDFGRNDGCNIKSTELRIVMGPLEFHRQQIAVL